MDMFSLVVIVVFLGVVGFFFWKALKGAPKGPTSTLNTGGGQGSSPVKGGKEELK